ncbi:MAG: AraC family transcriptional regulator [Kofleriaceae bacterium]
MDVLTDVLRAMRLQGTAYFQADFCAPWGMSIARDDVANFHVVVRGSCVASWEGEERELHAGDILVFPHGLPHALLDPTRPAPEPASELLARPRTDAQGRCVFGGDGAATELICGHFELDRAGGHPLFAALPRALLLRRGEGTDPEWLATATRLVVLESSSGRLGSRAVVDRLAEALMIQVIRAHAERLALSSGFLAALSDRLLGPALAAIHEDPAAAWSVELLARRIGASRSSFAARFKEVLGTSPMQYVTDWRMQGARALLANEELSIAQVAERVGYQSEFAFAKAYKRTFGEGPGAIRRRAS